MATTSEPVSLESAIPEHLRTERTVPARMPSGYQPAFPAYTARFPQSVKNVVMAIVGAQHTSLEEGRAAESTNKILSFVQNKSASGSPGHHDIAAVTDATGMYNEIVIAYWNNISLYEDWRKSSGFDEWWSSLDPSHERHGWFLEVFLPSIDRYETIYSDTMENQKPEGAGALSSHLSGLVQEHVYWGSMRDRLPISQTEELTGETAVPPEKDTSKTRVRVPGKKNLAVIRSGQDWSKTLPEERKLYLETMHPVLIKGMNFLRDEGGDIGCYSCRFMDVLNPVSLQQGTEQTFGLAYFDDLASLEKWSKEHQTHLNIFGGFLQYVKKLNFNVTLHLYHEVLVLKPEQQFFEYIGCHSRTGMLGGLEATA